MVSSYLFICNFFVIQSYVKQAVRIVPSSGNWDHNMLQCLSGHAEHITDGGLRRMCKVIRCPSGVISWLS